MHKIQKFQKVGNKYFQKQSLKINDTVSVPIRGNMARKESISIHTNINNSRTRSKCQSHRVQIHGVRQNAKRTVHKKHKQLLHENRNNERAGHY